MKVTELTRQFMALYRAMPDIFLKPSEIAQMKRASGYSRKRQEENAAKWAALGDEISRRRDVQ